MMLMIMAATWNTDPNQSPLLWVFPNPNELLPNKSKEVHPSSLCNVKTTLRQRTHVGTEWTHTGRAYRCLWKQMCRSSSHGWMQFEKGLKSPLGCDKTIIMRQDVLQSIFPRLLSNLCSTRYLVSEEELLTAGFGPYLRRILTVTGGSCHMNTPVKLKLLVGKSPAFLDESGWKPSSCPIETVQVQFIYCYFTRQMQWDAGRCSNVNKTASLEATKLNKS